MKMSYRDQCLVIEDMAVLIAERVDNKMRYYLFQLDSFYIEISVQLHNEIIENVYSFTNLELLNRYLTQIDISAIGSV